MRSWSWSSFGTPSSAPMSIAGILAAKSSTKSKPPPSRCGSRNCAHSSRVRPSSAATRRGVKARLTSRRSSSWPRRVHEDHHPEAVARRPPYCGGVVSIISEHRAAGRAVGLPVERRLEHVREAAQRVEVVLLVVVERRFVAEAAPHVVRRRVDRRVVRVVDEVGGLREHGRVFPAGRATFKYSSKTRSGARPSVRAYAARRSAQFENAGAARNRGRAV